MLKYDGTVDYYLDENDETKKADGTASDVANTSYAGNAMVEWGQLWWKIVPDANENGASFYIADAQVDDTYHAWNNVDCNGHINEHFYTPKYFGSNVSSKLRSISGAPNSVNTTRDTEITYAKANNLDSSNPIWYTEVYADWQLIFMLLFMMAKSTNVQTKYGYGRCSSSNSSTIGNGTMNGKGMFWGDTTQTNGVKVFGMENWWGHKWHRIFGLIGTSTGYLYKMTYNNYDGSTATSYNSTGSGYLTATNKSGTALVQPSTNYLNKCNYGQYGYLPIVTSSGSTSTYYSDYYYKGAYFLLVGGVTGSALDAGSSFFSPSNAFSSSNWFISASLSLKPLAPA
jgi:hypothetical protein